jgi:hypothetical protein
MAVSTLTLGSARIHLIPFMECSSCTQRASLPYARRGHGRDATGEVVVEEVSSLEVGR